MEKDEKYVIQLRDCFTGGYTLPQYCIDNGIKKPLFVSEEKFLNFAWEIYVQFRYDKRLTAQFSFIDLPKGNVNFSIYGFYSLSAMYYKNVSEINPGDFDKIILLTTLETNFGGKVITFAALAQYFTRKTYTEIPLLNFLQRFPKVRVFLTNFPNNIKRYKGGADYYSQLFEPKQLKKDLLDGKEVKSPFDKFGYTREEIIELITTDGTKQNIDGTTSIIDNNHPLMRIQNGKRKTAYQPEHYLNKIYFFGPCHHFGRNAPFDKTIESHLQKMLNEANLPYRVENESQAFSSRPQDMFYNLNNLNPKPGDIVFLYFWGMHSNKDVIPFCDVSDAFDPPNDFHDVFCTRRHVNEVGYKIVAKKFFKFLTENNFFRDVDINPPPPVNQFTAMVYHHNSSRAA